MRAPIRALITAGGTAEPIDDVRVVANHSTGRLGAALARALAWRGVQVTVLGSSRMMAHKDWLPPGVRRLQYRSYADFVAALDEALETPVDLLLMAAAVSDYSPVPHAGKLSSDLDTLSVHMARNPKILPGLRDRCGHDTVLVGFKLLSDVSSDRLLEVARDQRIANRLDLTIANDMSELGPTRHPLWIVGAQGEQRVDGDRATVADAVADAALARVLDEPPPPLMWPEVVAPSVGRTRRWWRVEDALVEQGAEEDLEPEEAASAWLASLRRAPWRPTAIPLRRARTVIGMGEVDQARLAEVWEATLARAGRLTAGRRFRTAWYRGQLAAVVAVDDAGVHTVVTTGLADDDVWPQAVLADGDPMGRTWAVPAAERTRWLARGFAQGPELDLRVLMTPPWQRGDVRPAASTALVHVPSRQVLLGRRLTEPSVGKLAFPGGRAERGESLLRTARRELAEETGIEAPDVAPWHTRRIWRGHDPTWALTCHVWRVPTCRVPRETSELAATWMDLDAAVEHPDVLPGARLVLQDVQDRLERT